jgi:hypothetical protein
MRDDEGVCHNKNGSSDGGPDVAMTNDGCRRQESDDNENGRRWQRIRLSGNNDCGGGG